MGAENVRLAEEGLQIPEYSGQLHDVAPVLQFGECIDERYEVLGRLRANASVVVANELCRTPSSAVYKCRDAYTDKDVALKIFIESNPGQQERVTAEIATHAHLSDDPLVVPFVGAGYVERGADRWRYMTTEYMPKGPLKGRRISENEVPEFLNVIEDYATVLGRIHDRGIVHGDVKPRNFLKQRDGGGVLADFGLVTIDGHTPGDWYTEQVRQSAAHDAVTQRYGRRAHTVQGTLSFISPEVLEEEDRTPAADMYALGGTIYLATTDKSPWDIGSKISTVDGALRAIDGMRLKAPHEINPSVPLALSRLAVACLRRDPEDRPLDDEMVDELRKIAA